MNKFFGLIAAAAMLVAFSASSFADSSPVNIAWSHYTGWEFLGYMQDSGIMDKWNKKMGTNVKFTFVGSYEDSVALFAGKQYNGVSVTAQDALAIAGVAGRHSVALIVGDYSNGNDGVALKGYKTLKDIKTPVALVQYSVSHYLLARCAEQAGMSIDQFQLEKALDSDIPSLVQNQDNVAVVSWNPFLKTIANTRGVNVVCDSSKIPGEIIDMVVVGDEVDQKSREAIVGAWYETIGLVEAGNKEVIAALAKQAGGSVEDFTSQLKTTHMFWTPADAVKFTKDAKLRETMEKVIKFSFNNGVFDGPKSVDEMGVKFPDGGVLYNPKNVMLTFDPFTMQEAADGKIK